MKTAEERGPIGAWAYDARADAGLSVEQVAERLAATETAVSAATLRGIESGSKKPGRALLRALAKVYGRTPPGATSAEPTDLATAITLQAKAIDRLAGQVEELLKHRDRDLQELARTLAALLATPAKPQGAEAPAAVRRASSRQDQEKE